MSVKCVDRRRNHYHHHHHHHHHSSPFSPDKGHLIVLMIIIGSYIPYTSAILSLDLWSLRIHTFTGHWALTDSSVKRIQQTRKLCPPESIPQITFHELFHWNSAAATRAASRAQRVRGPAPLQSGSRALHANHIAIPI